MKKLILILLSFTGFLHAQTLQNPTFGNTTTNTLKIKTPATVSTVNFLSTNEADGSISKIAPINVNIPYSPVNYSISNQSIGAHLTGIDTRLGQISSTTAGITQRVYFTADNTTVTAGTFFTSSTTGKGSTATGSPPALVLADNTKGYFTKDIISVAFPAATIGYAGSYTGQLTVSATPTPVATQQRFTVEIYRTNNVGTPIASGVSGAPTGDLGVTVVAILDSGILNLTAGSITNIPITGILTQNITLNTGERLRYHVSAAKIGSGGGNVTFGVYYGTSYNSYYDVPVAITTDAVLNKSTWKGITTSDVLNSQYKNAKQYGAIGDGSTDDTAILQSYLNSGQGIYLFPKGNYSVSGLDVNSYSQLYFEEGAVLTLRDNSNRSVLQNKNFSVNTDKNIEIYGIEIEGNEANQIKNSVTPPYTGEPTVGLRFFGVENLKIIGAKINKTRTYGIWLSRIKNGVFRDIEFNQSIATIDNQDGIHFNGLCYNLEISNIRGVTNDDMIALNADDVSQGSNVSFGEIKNVTIKDVIFNNNLNGIRLLSAGSLLDQIYINNLSGNIRDNVIAISSYELGTANFGSIVINGVNVDTNTPYNVLGEYGGYILVNDKINFLQISNVFRKTGADARPTVRIQSRADISKLVIDNITDVINQSLTTYLPEISFEAGSVVNQAFISDIRLMNGVYPNGYCIGATNSSINRLHLNNIYVEQIGYGLYLNNTDINTLFADVLNTNFIRYPFYLVNDSDIGLAQINDNGWLYSIGTPNVYNILDTSSIVFVGNPVAQSIVKFDDNYNKISSTAKEISGEFSNSLSTNGYAGTFEKTGGFGAPLSLKNSSGSTANFLRFFKPDGTTVQSDLSLSGTGLAFSSTLIASPAVLSTELVTKGQLDLVSIPYKIWVGVFQNNGTSAPTVTVNENTLGGTVVWTRSATGTYVGTLSGAFNTTAGKTILGFGGGAGTTANGFFSSFGATSANTVEFRTYISGAVSDTVLNGYTWVEIRVYP